MSATPVALQGEGVASMGPGKTARDRQAQAGTAGGSGGAPNELYEQCFDVALREPRTTVEHGKLEA